ncbi:hydroxymyristoyl-ACP dehydratase [Trinickia sp. LjRoot230]|uniref:hydroxymyristoyl-ACP dehydratase n=1 Tax=Trinickia sp. LjRoot230 TaxID=3342288 RepID=UPI003ECD9CEC
MSTQLEASEIYRRIPHAGAMRLLDAVQRWDERSIACTAHSHAEPQHPLRQNGEVSSVHALEYAAQAMAVHASLVRGGMPLGHVYVASFMKIVLSPHPLDRIVRSPLEIRAALEVSNASAARYSFVVTAGDELVARGAMTLAIGN